MRILEKIIPKNGVYYLFFYLVFRNIFRSNKDNEYHKYMQNIMLFIVFTIPEDAAEIAVKR